MKTVSFSGVFTHFSQASVRPERELQFLKSFRVDMAFFCRVIGAKAGAVPSAVHKTLWALLDDSFDGRSKQSLVQNDESDEFHYSFWQDDAIKAALDRNGWKVYLGILHDMVKDENRHVICCSKEDKKYRMIEVYMAERHKVTDIVVSNCKGKNGMETMYNQVKGFTHYTRATLQGDWSCFMKSPVPYTDAFDDSHMAPYE